MVGEEEPLLWVWHPQTGGQTLVFATPARDGWVFLWGEGGRGDAENLDHTARALRDTLASAYPGGDFLDLADRPPDGLGALAVGQRLVHGAAAQGREDVVARPRLGVGLAEVFAHPSPELGQAHHSSMDAPRVWVRHAHGKDPEILTPEVLPGQGQQGEAPPPAGLTTLVRTSGESRESGAARRDQAGTPGGPAAHATPVQALERQLNGRVTARARRTSRRDGRRAAPAGRRRGP